MRLYYREWIIIVFGVVIVVSNIWCIRNQFLVTNEQYILGIIPHHSMAVLMSKKLIQNQPPLLNDFVSNIITTQEKEIEYLKQLSTLSA